MIVKANKHKNTVIVLTIGLVLLVTLAFVLIGGFSKSNNRTSTETIISQVLTQPTLPESVIGVNETNILNATNSYNNYSSSQLNSNPISPDTLNYTAYKLQDLSGFFASLADNINQGQTAESDLTLPVTDPISLDTSKFVTYTYGGYPIQQPTNSTQFIFSFPDNTSQGQLAGSDALSWNAYAIQKMDFDASFIAPKINALGFDEMVIFATANTDTYKGTEFGIRMDLNDGSIYGYIQEPNGNSGDVNFEMLQLMPNDGIMHHYTLIMSGSEVSFYIDGTNYGYLNFPSNSDYSNLSFSICAVVHRFTDGWDSSGDEMIAGNFTLNKQ